MAYFILYANQFKTAIFSCFILFSVALSTNAQEGIYNEAVPEIIPVWHRVADASSQLRSVEAAEISPDGRFAISGGKFGYQAILWRIADGHLIWENAHESEIECVTFSPDSKLVATGGEDHFVRIWEVETGKAIQAIAHDSSIDGIAWSPDGKLLVSGTEKGEAHFWNTENYERISVVEMGSTINSMHFTRNSQQLLVGGNIQTPNPKTGQTHYGAFACRIDVSDGKILQTYKGNTASIKSVRFSPDEQFVATASFDSTACLFHAESGALLHQFKELLRIEAVTFTTDGKFLLTGGHDLNINFYRLKDYKLVYQLPSPRTEYLHFSKDGRLLLTSHEDSGLLSLYMLLSNVQQRGNYQQVADQQLNNKDLKGQ